MFRKNKPLTSEKIRQRIKEINQMVADFNFNKEVGYFNTEVFNFRNNIKFNFNKGNNLRNYFYLDKYINDLLLD